MKSTIIAVLIAAAVLPSCSKDDNQNNIDNTDRDFASKAWITNKFEIEVGQLAVDKSSNPAIVSFGQQMLSEHQSSRDQLQVIATDLGLALPDSLDSESIGLRAQLVDFNGRAFDSVYIHSQVITHQKAIVVFQTEQNSGRNDRLKNYASEQLPHLQMHLQRADSLAATY